MGRHQPEDRFKKERLRAQMQKADEMKYEASLRKQPCPFCGKGTIQLRHRESSDKSLQIEIFCNRCGKKMSVAYHESWGAEDYLAKFVDEYWGKREPPKKEKKVTRHEKSNREEIKCLLCRCDKCTKRNSEYYCLCPCPDLMGFSARASQENCP